MTGRSRQGPWDRIQKRVTEEHKLLADTMAARGHSAGLTLSEGVIVIDVVFQGRSHDLPGLAGALAAEVEQRTTLLSAREREILENHLLNEVARTLHELVSAAEAEVRQMNDELQARPTSTGMSGRLTWQQARNAPERLDRVRLKFRQTIDACPGPQPRPAGCGIRLSGRHPDRQRCSPASLPPAVALAVMAIRPGRLRGRGGSGVCCAPAARLPGSPTSLSRPPGPEPGGRHGAPRHTH